MKTRREILETAFVAAFVVATVCAGVGLVSANAVEGGEERGGSDWEYSKSVLVKENSGTTLTDYQVLVNLTGEDFPAEAKPDGSDLRFVNAEGEEEELSYWVEKFDAEKETGRVWVKVPEIPADGEAELKMLYGNPSAESASNGSAVFEFFDDFEGTSLDANKWSIDKYWYSGDGSNLNVTLGEFDKTTCVKILDQDSDGGITIRNYDPVVQTGVLEGRFYTTNYYLTPDHEFGTLWLSDNGSGYSAQCIGFSVDSGDVIEGVNGGADPYHDEYDFGVYDLSKWHTLSFAYDNNNKVIPFYKIDGETKGLGYSYYYKSNEYVKGVGGGWTLTKKDIYVDWIFLRKYASPEPTVKIEPGEEVPTVAVSTDEPEYSPGDRQTTTLRIANPTEENLTFQWFWGVPQYSIWISVLSSPVPPGYDETLGFTYTIPDWGATGFGNLFFVQLLDEESGGSGGEVLALDAACWAYSPGGAGGEATPTAEVDIAKKIKRAEIKRAIKTK